MQTAAQLPACAQVANWLQLHCNSRESSKPCTHKGMWLGDGKCCDDTRNAFPIAEIVLPVSHNEPAFLLASSWHVARTP